LTQTLMHRETGEAAAAIRRLLEREGDAIAHTANLLASAPGPVTTAARGSSDHAVTLFKYACEIELGRPVASIGPSVASVYGASLRLAGGLHLTVSQSGASPDIVALQEAARRGGAHTVALVNVADGPAAAAADLVLPVHAGPERSVAATKSWLATCAALLAIVAQASENAALKHGLARLPDALEAFDGHGIEQLSTEVAGAESLYLAARGPAFGVALEAALKAKETAGIHAEAFSVAELMHGPLRLVGEGFPVVMFVADDAARDGALAAIDRLRDVGGRVRAVTTLGLDGAIRTPATGHPTTDGLVFAFAWYRAIEAAARMRGLDPDRPANLRKVTETL
jgi:glucosamine--fructose-6-phosphate aminotransferase (isomerizing)